MSSCTWGIESFIINIIHEEDMGGKLAGVWVCVQVR